MPNDSKQLSYLKRNAARSKDIFLLDPNHVLAAAHDLCCHYSLQLQLHYMCNGTITVMVIYTASAGPGGPITLPLHPITITPLHITAAHYTLGRGRETLKHEFVVILCSPP